MRRDARARAGRSAWIGRPRSQIKVVGDLDDLPVLALAAVRAERANPRRFADLEDRGADLVSQFIAGREAQAALATEVDELVRRARRIGGTKISIVSISSAGTCARACSTTATWSPAALEPALPGRRIAASTSAVSSQ